MQHSSNGCPLSLKSTISKAGACVRSCFFKETPLLMPDAFLSGFSFLFFFFILASAISFISVSSWDRAAPDEVSSQGNFTTVPLKEQELDETRIRLTYGERALRFQSVHLENYETIGSESKWRGNPKMSSDCFKKGLLSFCQGEFTVNSCVIQWATSHLICHLKVFLHKPCHNLSWRVPLREWMALPLQHLW